MTANWLTRMARLIGFRRSTPAPRFRPAWFDATYLSASGEPVPPQPRRSFAERERAAVWQKGLPMPGWDPEDWRIDHRRNPMFRHHYGDSQSAFGWEVGLIRADGGDDLVNLRPQLCRAPLHSGRFERTFDLDRFVQ